MSGSDRVFLTSKDERQEFWRAVQQNNRKNLMSKSQRDHRALKNSYNKLPDHPTKPTFEQVVEWELDAVCNICGKTKQENGKSLCMDHDHATDEFRGFLCSDCNCLLGYARDREDLLTKAREYLLDPPARSFL